MDTDFFDDNKYFEKIFESKTIDCFDLKKIEKAFELSHDVRKFEIELFWKRGTYFWAFILAIYTAYFCTFKTILGTKELNLGSLIGFSDLSKFCLLMLSGMSFIFCFSWVLINKGSKFWQKNWEAQIDMLEEYFSGHLYKTFLNTNNKIGFNKSPIRKDAYDYSVTKITTVSSIILMILSACLFLFHFYLLLSKLISSFIKPDTILTLVFTIVLVLSVIVAICELLKCEGNIEKTISNKKWRQRSKFENTEGK